MADISAVTWHESDSANTDAPPDGWPEGQPANSVNNCARSMMGATKRFYDRINATITSGGSANAHTLTYTVAPTALVKGDRYAFIAGFTNTSATTLNVGVGGALAVKVGATALGSGTITAGDVVEVAYDGAIFQFLGWDPARIITGNLTANTLTLTGAAGNALNVSPGGINVGLASTFGGDVTISGTIVGLQGITIGGLPISNNTGNIDLSASGLEVAFASSFGGDLTVDGNLNAMQSVIIGGISVSNAFGNINIPVGIAVGFASTFGGDLTIAGQGFKPGGGAWAATSDARVKKNVSPYATSLDKVLALNPVSYQYNGLGGTVEDGRTHIGLIADDVKPVMPEMVSSTRAKLNPDDADDTDILNLNSSALVFALLNSVKELNTRIAALEAKNGSPPT